MVKITAVVKDRKAGKDYIAIGYAVGGEINIAHFDRPNNAILFIRAFDPSFRVPPWLEP